MSQAVSGVKTIKLEKLSRILGPLSYVEHEQPYTNKRTGETTTTITVHSSEQLEKYDVKVQGDLSKALANIKRGDEIDFANVEFGHNAEIMDGWGDKKKAGLNDIVNAVDIIYPVAKQKSN